MSKKMFDMVIGNPPYQEQNNTNGRQPLCTTYLWMPLRIRLTL